MGRRARRTSCEHEWVENYNPVDASAAYREVFHYSPFFEACTKCGRRRKKRSEPWLDWRDILMMPLFIIGVIVLEPLSSLTIVGAAIYEDLLSKKEP
jgi:hypothetical protein